MTIYLKIEYIIIYSIKTKLKFKTYKYYFKEKTNFFKIIINKLYDYSTKQTILIFTIHFLKNFYN